MPGTVLDEQFTIACGEGAIKPLRLQRPGKKPMPATDMLKGHPVPTGEVLQ
jgi:methionyl-tRNA formyltransferase